MIEWKPRVLASGLGFPEGPVLLGHDDVAFVETSAQRVSRARAGGCEVIADVGGGPNGATLGADGALYIANNGGLTVGPEGYWRAPEPIDGCVQRVTLDGAVSVVAATFPAPSPRRPNDLCVGPDGALYVTDPHNWEDLANLGPGAVWRIDGDDVTQVAEVPSFVNGIAFGPDDRLFVAQSMTMTILEIVDGDPRPFATLERGFPDGFCFAADGTLIVCGSMGHAISVFDAGGALVETVDTGEGTEPTNCCLGDGVLYVTLSGIGELVAVDVDAAPLPLYPARA